MENSYKPNRQDRDLNPQTPNVFEFTGTGTSVQEISFDDLQRTIRRESGLAGIRSIPAQYWKLYGLILSMLADSEVNYTEKPIWVQQNSSKAYLTDDEKAEGHTSKNAPINRWRFDKILSIIQIPGLCVNNVIDSDSLDVNARNAAIGITLNKEGLSVAFGMNVWACSNFNVMGGTVMHSYGSRNRDAMPWDVMKHRLQDWIGQHNQIWTVQNEIMTAMQEMIIPDNSTIIDELVGNLYEGAIKQAYFKGNAVPFNTNELSNFVQESINKRSKEEQLTNIWDVYNWGTEIMKPGRFDIGEIADNSNMWSDYLIDRFKLDVPKQIINLEAI